VLSSVEGCLKIHDTRDILNEDDGPKKIQEVVGLTPPGPKNAFFLKHGGNPPK